MANTIRFRGFVYSLLFIFLFFLSPFDSICQTEKTKPDSAYRLIYNYTITGFQKPGNKILQNKPLRRVYKTSATEIGKSFKITGTINLDIVTTGGSCGYGNGSIIVTASGGTSPYVYSYNYLGAFTYTQNTGNFQQLAGGPYVITVTDATGLSVTTNVDLPNTYPEPHVDVASSQPPSTCTGFDGSITLTGSAGTPPYQYSIDGVNYQPGNVFTGLSQGFYSPYIRDANNCIYAYQGLVIIYNDNGNCYNKFSVQTFSVYSCNNNGTITLGTPFAGTPPYSYSLDGITYQASTIFNNLAPGPYHIYFKDATGLTNIVSVYIIPACIVSISLIEVDAACGQNDGGLTATVINGTPPYTYSLDGINFQTGNTFNGLASGNYTLTVKDLNGETVSQQTTVYNKCPTVYATETDETCTDKNGTITATGNKGTAPYQFSIDGINFQPGNVFTNLASGSYTVTIKDAGNFTSTYKETINDNCLQLSLSESNTTCSNKNGTITATVQNGTSPYQYSADGITFQAGNVFTNLPSGSYTITVKDAAGLTTTSSTIITDAAAPKIYVALTQASCSNTNGSITIKATGGTAPLQFSIDNGNSFQSNNIFNNLDSSQYIVVTKDSNGCSVNDTVQLTALPTPYVFLGNDTTVCINQTLILTAPQVAGEQYFWQDNSTANNFTVTEQGSYWVKVTNQFGCFASDTINVSYKSVPAFGIGNDTSLCTGKLLALQPSIVLLQAGYLWSTGDTSFSIHVNAPGLYWLQVSNSGCTKRDSITINYKPNPVINLGNDTTVCEGQAVLLDATNNNAIYTWQDGSTQPTFTVTNPGTYSVRVNENGCDTSGQISINYNTRPVVQLGKDTTLCITEQLILEATYPHSVYEWQDGSSLPQFTVTKAGTYSVDVSNACGDTKDSIHVTYENCACKFYVPSAFTPNNDGKNDIFLPKYQCIFINYQLKIFNRWGQLVFVSVSPSAGWDGTLNKQPQPGGTYVWEMSYKDNLTGKVTHRNGTITLIR